MIFKTVVLLVFFALSACLAVDALGYCFWFSVVFHRGLSVALWLRLFALDLALDFQHSCFVVKGSEYSVNPGRVRVTR